MILRVRRAIVLAAVALSLVLGLVSIRIAAQMAAAAAPPPAPPVSIADLEDQLAAEQGRAANLEAQLDELNGLTGDLVTALAATEDQVGADGLTADELRSRLKAAEAKLAKVNKLLKKAEARLATLQRAASASSGGSGGGSGSSSGGSGSGGGSGPAPTPNPQAGVTLKLSLSGSDVTASWSKCSFSGFVGYSLVRSTDKEVHFPPEDKDTEVARTESATTATDNNPPSGTLSYRVYCLYLDDGKPKAGPKSGTVQISVP